MGCYVHNTTFISYWLKTPRYGPSIGVLEGLAVLAFYPIVDADCVAYADELMLTCRQQSLFHVLAAYSVYNTEVGYCQGMSQLAALLLMYMNEEVCRFLLCANA